MKIYFLSQVMFSRIHSVFHKCDVDSGTLFIPVFGIFVYTRQLFSNYQRRMDIYN